MLAGWGGAKRGACTGRVGDVVMGIALSGALLLHCPVLLLFPLIDRAAKPLFASEVTLRERKWFASGFKFGFEFYEINIRILF